MKHINFLLYHYVYFRLHYLPLFALSIFATKKIYRKMDNLIFTIKLLFCVNKIHRPNSKVGAL